MTTRSIVLISLLAIVATDVCCIAKGQSQPVPFPAKIARFDSRQIPSRSHPFIFYTKSDARKAAERAKDPRYGAALRSLNEKAMQARQLKLESIDPAWWADEKTKPWADTYPIIYEKTCLVPVRMALPAHYAAMRFLMTGDKADLEAAIRILMHLSAYTFEFEHYDVGMNYSVWGCHVLSAYDILFDHLDAGQRLAMDAFFTRMGRAVLKNDIYWIENGIGGGINNHLAWHKMMLVMLGLFYDRHDLVEYALNGRRGILPLLNDGLVDDGLWCESSLTYHFTAIVPMMYLANAMKNAGYKRDLFAMKTASGRSLRQPYDAIFGCLFPDRLIPPIGDAYGRRVRIENEFTYAYAARAWDDPKFRWVLSHSDLDRPELLFVGINTSDAAAPPISSRLYKEHGYAFLRTASDQDYWAGDATCAFLTFDKSGVHCHQDKLSLMLFAHGKLLLPDVEAKATVAHAFSAKVQRQLNRSALSQNTVMIDYHDQRSISRLLTLVDYRDEPGCKTVTAADTSGALYEGVRQSRTVVLTDDYCLDVFQVVADRPRDICWIIHTIGDPRTRQTSLALESAENKLPAPAQWLGGFRESNTDGPFAFDWTEDGVTLRMAMAAETGTDVISCGYPKTDEPNCPVIPMLIVHRKAASTIFTALYRYGTDDKSPVTLARDSSGDGHLVIRVESSGRTRRYEIPALK